MADVKELLRVAIVDATNGLPVSVLEVGGEYRFRVSVGSNAVTQHVQADTTRDQIPAIVEDTLAAIKDLKDSTYGQA